MHKINKLQMNQQLESYYHSSSPQRMLDRAIKPIISKVHHTNINSLHQLKFQLQPQSQPRTPPVFTPPALEKLSSLKQHPFKPSSLPPKRNSFTLSPKPRCQDQERIMTISPVSKVKKHLVDQINFDQIKETFFKKRKTLNRFQQFCESIKERERSPLNNLNLKRQAKLLSFRQPKMYSTLQGNRSFQSEVGPEKEQKVDNFRITTRKKFWKLSAMGKGEFDILDIRSIWEK